MAAYLMSLESSQVRIQICKSVVNFFNTELPGKLLSGKPEYFYFLMIPATLKCLF